MWGGGVSRELGSGGVGGRLRQHQKLGGTETLLCLHSTEIREWFLRWLILDLRVKSPGPDLPSSVLAPWRHLVTE